MSAVKSLEGLRYGRITVLCRAGSNRHGFAVWKVKCDCGSTFETAGGNLRRGHTTSCGCKLLETKKAQRSTGLGQTFWNNIVRNARKRNIPVVISREQAFEIFQSQSGKCALSGLRITLKRPSERGTASLDRIDSSRGYELGNLQWVHKDVNAMKGTLLQRHFIFLAQTIAHHLDHGECPIACSKCRNPAV